MPMWRSQMFSPAGSCGAPPTNVSRDQGIGARLKYSASRSARRTTLTTFGRSEEHTSELQSLMRISYAVFCLKKKNKQKTYRQPQIIRTHTTPTQPINQT